MCFFSPIYFFFPVLLISCLNLLLQLPTAHPRYPVQTFSPKPNTLPTTLFLCPLSVLLISCLNLLLQLPTAHPRYPVQTFSPKPNTLPTTLFLCPLLVSTPPSSPVDLFHPFQFLTKQNFHFFFLSGFLHHRSPCTAILATVLLATNISYSL